MKQKILHLLIGGILASSAFSQPVILEQKVIGGSYYDELRCVLKTQDGGMVTGGITYSNKSGQKTQNTRGGADYWVVKMDKHGKVEWDRTYGGNGDDGFKSLIQTSDGGYALIGESNSNISVEKDENSRGDYDYWIVKLDKHGDVEWNKTIGGNGTEYIDNIVQTKDGGYVLAGSSYSDSSGEKTENRRGEFDYWVVRLDKKGRKIWDKTIGGNSWEFCSPIINTKDGGVLVGGFSASNASGEKSENSRGDYDYWVIKLDKFGSIEWNKTIGGDAADFCHAMLQTEDGGYLLGGNSPSNISGEKTDGSRGGYDYWLVKLDKNGTKTWDKTIGGNNDDANVWSLQQTEDKGYILEGISISDISGEKTEACRGDFDFWAVKLDKNYNIQWDKTIGGAGNESVWGNCVQEIKKNVFVVGGTSWSGVSGDKTEEPVGEADFWLTILDARDMSAAPVNSASTNIIAEKPAAVSETFTVFPNPARDKLYVHSNAKTTFMLLNEEGKQVRTQSIERSGIIDISALPAGAYYLINKGNNKTQKIMIVK